MALGIGVNETNEILSDWQRAVTLEVSTKSTTNITGSELESYATGSSVNVIFLKRELAYIFEKEGIVEKGDAYVICATAVGVKRYDRITVDSEKYLVENVIIRRAPDGTALFYYCILFKVNTS